MFKGNKKKSTDSMYKYLLSKVGSYTGVGGVLDPETLFTSKKELVCHDTDEARQMRERLLTTVEKNPMISKQVVLKLINTTIKRVEKQNCLDDYLVEKIFDRPVRYISMCKYIIDVLFKVKHTVQKLRHSSVLIRPLTEHLIVLNCMKSQQVKPSHPAFLSVLLAIDQLIKEY